MFILAYSVAVGVQGQTLILFLWRKALNLKPYGIPEENATPLPFWGTSGGKATYLKPDVCIRLALLGLLIPDLLGSRSTLNRCTCLHNKMHLYESSLNRDYSTVGPGNQIW